MVSDAESLPTTVPLLFGGKAWSYLVRRRFAPPLVAVDVSSSGEPLEFTARRIFLLLPFVDVMLNE
jgi:hypothetical protein